MEIESDFFENFESEFIDVPNLDEYEEKTKMIEKRLESLRNSMGCLKQEIRLEKTYWEKENEEIKKWRVKDGTESKVKEKPTLTDPGLLDYEKKLSMYHEALVKSHIERRLQLRRHLIAEAYKKRLLEIENMCNVELLKVKQSVQNLQPLQAIASEWRLDAEITGPSKDARESEAKRAAPEPLPSEHKPSTEIKDILVYTTPTRSSIGTNSSVVQEEEEDTLMNRRLHSMSWYNNEIYYPYL